MKRVNIKALRSATVMLCVVAVVALALLLLRTTRSFESLDRALNSAASREQHGVLPSRRNKTLGYDPWAWPRQFQRPGGKAPVLIQNRDLSAQESYWKRSGRFVLFHHYLDKCLQEPLAAEDLRFLEKKLFSDAEPRTRLSCAMLLYRYGRKSGEDFLLANLTGEFENPVIEALAMNQDPRCLPHYQRVMAERSTRGFLHDVTGLLRVAREWQEPRIGLGLTHLSNRRVISAPLAESLAAHNLTPFLRNIRGTVRQHSDNSVISRIHAALYELEGDLSDHAKALAELEADLSPQDLNSLLRRYAATMAATALGTEESLAALQKQVEEICLDQAHGNSETIKTLGNFVLTAMVMADEDFLPRTCDVLMAAFQQFQTDYHCRLRIASTFANRGTALPQALAEALGEDVVNLVAGTRDLRRIPTLFLPDGSKGLDEIFLLLPADI